MFIEIPVIKYLRFDDKSTGITVMQVTQFALPSFCGKILSKIARKIIQEKKKHIVIENMTAARRPITI